MAGCSAAAAAKSLQSCSTLCYPIDGSPPGSAVPGEDNRFSVINCSFTRHENLNIVYFRFYLDCYQFSNIVMSECSYGSNAAFRIRRTRFLFTLFVLYLDLSYLTF